MLVSDTNNIGLQRIQPKDCVFLLIDVQEKLLPAMAECERMLASNAKILGALSLFNIPLLVSEQYPQGLGETASELQKLYTEEVQVCEKRSFSVADDSSLMQKINDSARSTILISGIETHVCVWQSARDLANRGYRSVVVENATTSRSQSDHSCAIMRMAQVGIEIVSVEMLLFDLQKTSKGEDFKLLSKLVR